MRPRTFSWVRQRHTVAAIVYFLYGLFYLFGAQYLISMQATQRGMSNSTLFLLIGACIALLFPWLLYSRFALAFSLRLKPQAQRHTLYIDFALILGILVVLRVIALLRGGLYLKTPLHTAAVIIAALNAACLLWAAVSKPMWVSHHSPGP